MINKNITHLCQKLVIITIFTSLSACSIFSYSPKKIPQQYYVESDWPTIKQSLAQLENWKVMGKIGIRTKDDSMTAAINQWSQSKDTFIIDLSSTFLGLGATRIMGNEDYIIISDSDEDPISSNQPDNLIESALGFPLPVSLLSSWIKAIPSPGSEYKISFNPQSLPLQLQQHNWQINYSNYSNEHGLPLPGKVKLQRGETRITLVIKKWTIL